VKELLQQPQNTLTLVLGCARVDQAAALRREKQDKKEKWTDDDESRLAAVVARVRDALLFVSCP
jgi:hypothetical protein